MTAHEHVPQVTEDFLYGETSDFATKQADFIRAGASQLQLVLDFDRTLTVAQPGTSDDVTTWRILNEHLPLAGKATYQALYEHHRALELAGTMTPEVSAAWTSRVLDLFVQHQVDMAAVEREFLAKASIRPGTAELFALCAEYSIPTIILSAGIKDVHRR